MVVNCEKCKAPYQVHEQQIGEDGLIVRCTACQHSFRVVTKKFYLVEKFAGESAQAVSLNQVAEGGEDAASGSSPPANPDPPAGEEATESKRANDLTKKIMQIAPANSIPLERRLEYKSWRPRSKRTQGRLPLLFILLLLAVAIYFWPRLYPDHFEATIKDLRGLAFNVRDSVVPETTAKEEARSYYVRGRGAFAMDTKEHYLEALELYRKALTLDPNYPEVHGALAEAAVEAAEIYNQENTPAKARELLDEALRSSTKAVTLSPQNLEGGRAMAAYERLEGNFVKSQEYLSQLLVSNPADAETFILMGRNYLTKNGLEEMAEKHLLKAVSLNDLSIRAHRYLAVMHEKRKENEEALKEWQRVRDLNAQHDAAIQHIAFLEGAMQKPAAPKPQTKAGEKMDSSSTRAATSTSLHPEEPHEQSVLND